MILEAFLTTLLLLIIALFLKNKPPTPPSYDSTIKRENPMAAFFELYYNPSYF